MIGPGTATSINAQGAATTGRAQRPHQKFFQIARKEFGTFLFNRGETIMKTMNTIKLFLLCILALVSQMTLTAQDISVFYDATTNAASEHANNGSFYFADTGVGEFSAYQPFTIKNSGAANLTGLALSKSGSNTTDFVVSSLAATTLAPQAFTTFYVAFAPTAGGSRQATLNIASNDPDENPFKINLRGYADTSEITVYGPDYQDLTNNVGTNSFPDTVPGISTAAQTFTIRNIGRANLTGLALSKTGANAADFTLGAPGSTSLAPYDSATFTVTFAPTGLGNRNAVVNIASNDPDENPFQIHVTGKGIVLQITQQPTGATACLGGSARFSVVAPGATTYQWQRRQPGSATFANISGATSSAYNTPATVAADEGTGFRVLVSKNVTNQLMSSEALLSVMMTNAPAVVYNFSSSNLGGATVYGDAAVSNGVLELTRLDVYSLGAFLTPDLAPGEEVAGFTATFKVRIIRGQPEFADGFSFNWATDLPAGTYWGEQGAGSGLSVCFDTYESDASSRFSMVRVLWQYNLIGSYVLNTNLLPGTPDFGDVAIRLRSDGTLDVSYRCTSICGRLPLPGYQPLLNSRFGLGARTGGFYETHTIDDLAIGISAPAILDASVPGDIVVPTSTNVPIAQAASKAIDNNITNKYLNFDKLNTGLIITPTGKRPVRSLTLISAEDAPERDPSSFVLEGANDGSAFIRIASNSVPAFPTRHYIRSFTVPNTNVFDRYRLVFPTVSNAVAANSMQIAEIELLQDEEITSTNDAVTITLPPGAADVRGVGALFDRQLDGTAKLEIAPITNSSTIVDITLGVGAKVLKGFELIGAADDFSFPGRRPSSVTVAGSSDGTNYITLATVVPDAPSFNLQVQEFSTTTNYTAFARYRVAFGPPISGNRLQVGEMRLFGENDAPAIEVYNGTTTNAVALRTNNLGTFAFANTSVGGSVTQFFTIRSAGKSSLTMLGLSSSGTNAGEFRTGGLSGGSLAPDATMTFWVAFEPSASGTRAATIQLASSDANANPFRINVSGVGTSTAIVQQPLHSGGCVGGVAFFNVGTDSPGLSYQWQKRTAGTLTFSNIVGATASSYLTPALTAADDGAGFRVLVSDGANTTISSEALLSVITINSPTATNDFTGGNLGGGNIYGDASVTNEKLVLTPAAPDQSGAFLLPLLAPGELVEGFTAQFKVQMVPGPDDHADGFSFNWATDLPNGTFPDAERGVGSGLSVCFDTFEGGGVEERRALFLVKWNANTIATVTTYPSFLPGTNNDFADVAIRLNSDGTVDVSYRCTPIFSHLPIPGYTPLFNARFGFGARTGGYYESHVIDDLAIKITRSVLDASIPGDPAVGASANSPAGYGAARAIDNNVTTKYLNFDKLNTGLTIMPTGHRPVRALTLISAEDAPERDPSSFVLEGSNDGANFIRIASNAVPPFVARNTVQSFAVTNTNVFNQYRVLFPTVSNAATANSMQIAEVELLYHPEITSTNDALSITLAPGAVDVRGVGMLFDRQLGLTRKLEVAPVTNNTVVNLTPSAGATILKGFEVIGAADDFSFPGRRPSSVTVAGSNDGTNYTDISTVVPVAPSFNLQIQEFSTVSNAMAFAHYQITFGPPVSGNRLQVGEMRLFGDIAPLAPPVLSIRAAGTSVILSWPNAPGFALESKPVITDTNWSIVGVTPVFSNDVNTVTVPVNGDASFFRLRK
jgi:hypothetical protein